MLGNLIGEIQRLNLKSLQLIEHLPIIELSQKECDRFSGFIQKVFNARCICNTHSFQVETSHKHWAVCSNQYIALAAIARDFAVCLKKYFDFFDANIRQNVRETQLIIDLQKKFEKATVANIADIGIWLNTHKCSSYINHCTNYPDDEKSLCYFLAAVESKKFGNDKGALRSTQDLFGAYILANEPVTTAASGFLGGLVYALSQDFNYFDEIVKIFERSEPPHCNHSSLVSHFPYSFSPAQIIYYGVPGSGKSHSVDVEINNRIAAYNANKDDNDKLVCAKQVIRTVFHPDYCYTDFIGQIMPKKNSAGEFKYEFKPGPFARIIRSAYLNPQKPYFLVIEEINRGNAAAIFGETFQLLDRYVTGETSKTEEVCNENYGYSEGWSRYPINNDELNEYILQGGESSVTEKEPGVEYDSDFADDPQAAIKIPSIGLHFSSYCGIRLPPNLSIYATMNTSDQNVFTLDNAFQRRWTMKQISSELENTGASADQYNQTIKRNAKDKDGKNILVDTNVKWGDFRKAINEVIMESALENGLSSMEDKRLGGWFYVKSDNFAEKVLKYLWDDAFKFSRSDHFGEIRTLEELVEKFNEQGFDVFTDTSISDLQPPKSSSSSSDEV